MFWEEKIDRLKKETDPADFRVPFTDGSAILKNIEENFIIKENPNYRFSNWEARVKNNKHLKTILTAAIENELDKLDSTQNYWVVLTSDKGDFKNLVYDCKPVYAKKLQSLWNEDFYVVEKKYNWLIFFKRRNEETDIFKSGNSLASQE